MDIIETKNYTMFKKIKGNRKVNESHVQRLIASISEKNLLAENPIIVNEVYEIVDGQHRLEAAKRLAIPIYYTVKQDTGIVEMQLLNANNKPWTSEDYLNSFVERGLTDYQILKDFIEEYKIPLSLSVAILANRIGNEIRRADTDSLVWRFRTGRWKVESLSLGEEWANDLWALNDYADKRVIFDRDFVRSLDIMKSKNVKVKDLINKLQDTGQCLKRRPTIREYLRDLEDILNFRRHEDNHVQLVR